MTTPESPAERLRLGADLITQTAAGTSSEPWDSPHVRAALVPWVALMSPDLAAPLAAILRAEADRIDTVYGPLAATVGADQLPAARLADRILGAQR